MQYMSVSLSVVQRIGDGEERVSEEGESSSELYWRWGERWVNHLLETLESTAQEGMLRELLQEMRELVLGDREYVFIRGLTDKPPVLVPPRWLRWNLQPPLPGPSRKSSCLENACSRCGRLPCLST